jgi:hypothetical protein
VTSRVVTHHACETKLRDNYRNESREVDKQTGNDVPETFGRAQAHLSNPGGASRVRNEKRVRPFDPAPFVFAQPQHGSPLSATLPVPTDHMLRGHQPTALEHLVR